jgi:RNA polymerase sigma factor (TIGR02999 family)
MTDAVYAELRRLAAARLAREPAGHTLQATALVHEAYLNLADRLPADRTGVLRAAAVAMRRVVVDHARARLAAKRGGGRRVDLDPDQFAAAAFDPADLLALDDALARLAADDPAAAELAGLRLFAGSSADAAADALGVSRATAYRLWQYARARLTAGSGDTSPSPTR